VNHHSTYGRFPSGGWGWFWCGYPDRATGPEQEIDDPEELA
jgi:hypothetical protein